jgi:hypothetical protein
MQTLKKLYRSNYAGESIISSLTLSDGEWNPTTEFITNRVFNTHVTTQAVAIGNGESRLGFNLRLIGDHRGGLLAQDKLQTYGCNALYRDFTPDFLVAVGDEIIREIAESGYTDNNIVYANAKSVLDYPGKFYLTPQNLLYDAGALAAYQAAFDGHTKIFLIGYDQYDNDHHIDGGAYNNVYKDTAGYLTTGHDQNSKFFGLTLNQVITTYSEVDFIRVMPTSTWWQPAELRPLANFRQISYQDFTYEADLGAIGSVGTGI